MSRADNRAAMPTVAGVVDTLNKHFSPVRVIFAEERGRKLGKQPPSGVIPRTPST